ncbi:MAG: acylphosphatase [Phycisphaerales bacterium JB040]
MHRRRIRFEGRVQGVFFRATTRRCAAGFDVTGWVRNEPDGTVLLEVQGAPDEVERFLSHHREQRPGHVERESGKDIPPVEGETGFVVAG